MLNLSVLRRDALKSNPTFLLGLVLLLISFSVFVITMFFGEPSDDFFTQSFFLNYILFWVFLIAVFVNNKREFGHLFRFKNSHHNILLLQLANLCAYSLNRSIPVFNESTDWLTNYLVFYHLALLVYCFRKNDEVNALNLTVLLTVSTGLVFHLYEAIFIIHVYPVTAISFWFFGISLLSLVPAWHFLQAIHITRRYLKASTYYRSLLIGGIVIPLVMAIIFSVRWYNINEAITSSASELERPLSEETLPPWVIAASNLQDDAITKRILKGGIVYQLSDQFFSWGNGFSRINEKRQHDPFVVMASVFTGELQVNDQTRIKLLNTIYGNRHQTERKLWSGDKLVTDHIKTHVQLFPAYRLSYTEKVITIRNTHAKGRWRGQQEALYTFYLPEGGVVTSASLWIEGEESPARLTTRSKADSAYQRIVGVETRDPLLVHWQEGNRVTARIFPVLPGETRQFKLGVTAPLSWQNGDLQYDNIDFQGPFWQHAREEVEVVTASPLLNLSTPWTIRESGNSWRYEGRYFSDWKFRFQAPPLSTSTFTFNGRGIQLQEHRPLPTSFTPQTIYLDINRAWSKRALKKIWKMIKGHKVYVFTNRMEEVTEENHKRLFKLLRKKRFSLFPFYQIEPTPGTLVITNYSGLTPTLDDLKESEFADHFSSFLQNRTHNIKLYNLGNDLSPYLRSLRDLRLFDYAEGDIGTLNNWLAEQEFQVANEGPKEIVNHQSHFSLQEVAPAGASTAPDHLLRLFAYNDLLKKIGKDYFNKDAIADTLIHQAAEAHVLTPVSSLIVLESQADYERFDIKESKNSLGNAKIKSSGSVPEPHEWLLIILGLLFMLWLWKQPSVR